MQMAASVALAQDHQHQHRRQLQQQEAQRLEPQKHQQPQHQHAQAQQPPEGQTVTQQDQQPPQIHKTLHSHSPIDQDQDDADQGSSSLAITAVCRQCSAVLGEFYNAWIRISGTYYLPALRSSYRITGLRESGKARPALGSELDGCEIRPLLCKSCNDTLAIVCTKAAAHKPSYSGREFFKLTKISLRADNTGEEVAAILEESRVESKIQPSMPHSTMDVEPPPIVQKTIDHVERGPSPIAAGRRKSDEREQESGYAPAPREHVSPSGYDEQRAQVNGHPPAAPHSISIDAISRLQTQIAYNTAGLQTQKRTLVRIDNAVGRLQMEMQHVLSVIDGLKMEIRSRGASAPAPKSPNAASHDANDLEIFASNLSNVANKANEVDGLKLQLELLKRRIKKLEETTPGQLPSVPSQHDSPQTHTPSAMPPAPSSHYQTPGPHVSPPNQYRMSAPRMDMRQPSVSHPVPSQDHSQGLHASQVNKWVTVNPSAKRPLPNGVDAVPYQVEDLGSAKRPKLAPIEPRRAYEPAVHQDSVHDRMDIDDSEAGKRPIPRESQGSTTSSHGLPHASTADHDPAETWPHDAQRPMVPYVHELRSPKRGARGGARGRGRKSFPATPAELGSIEWSRGEWPTSQVGPDAYYAPISPAPPGSGGSGAAILRPGDSPGAGTLRHADPYAHTKKTRTKPTRNADGVLVRKDGRPDMRSQSSAANLRKVHARSAKDAGSKSAEPSDGGQQAHTPKSALATAPVVSAGSPAVSEEVVTPEGSATQSKQRSLEPQASIPDRHEAIMSKMFPRGVEEQRRRMSVAEQLFSGEGSARPESVAKSEREVEESQNEQVATPAEMQGGAVQDVPKVESEAAEPEAAEPKTAEPETAELEEEVAKSGAELSPPDSMEEE